MAWCTACKCECDVIDVDFGVGWTQVGSKWDNDVDVQQVSDCCEAPYVEDEWELEEWDDE